MLVKQQAYFVLLAQFLIIASLEMSDPYWPLIIRHANSNFSAAQLQFWSALIYMAPFLITMMATPIWSHLGQKTGQKKMLLRACLALTMTQLLLCFITDPVLILVVRSIQGLFAGFSAAAQAWSMTMTDKKSHGVMIGKLQSATAVGAIIGPAFGGCIAEYIGYAGIFLISGLVIGGMACVLMQVLQETPKKLPSVATKLNIRFLDKPLLYFLIIICMGQAARWMNASYFSLYIVEKQGGSSATVGILYSVMAIMMFLSSPYWGKVLDKYIQKFGSVKWLLVLVMVTAGFSQCLFAYADRFSELILASLVWGLSMAGIALIPFALLVRYANETHKGLVIGLGSSASKLGNLLGVGAGAMIQTITNYTGGFIAVGLLYFAIASVLLIINLHLYSADLETC